MRFFSILFFLMFIVSCAPKGYYKKLAKGKEIQSGLQTVDKNFKGEIYIENSPIECKVVLINLDKSILIRKQEFSLKKGADLKLSIRNGFYELNIVYKNRTYFFRAGSTYLSMWKINLKYFLEKAKKIHAKRKESFFIIKI